MSVGALAWLSRGFRAAACAAALTAMAAALSAAADVGEAPRSEVPPATPAEEGPAVLAASSSRFVGEAGRDVDAAAAACADMLAAGAQLRAQG
jgi:hypothetical protein